MSRSLIKQKPPKDDANVLSKKTDSSRNQMTCLTIPPQKKGSQTKMPLIRYNTTKTAKRKHQYKTLDENIGQPSTLLVTNRLMEKSAENLKLVVPKKHCLSVDSDDLKSLNSVDTSIVSDSDKSFSEKSKLNCKKATNKNNVGKKHKVSLVELDFESVSSRSDRYRELRDRNNKASRKSRLNRKSREVEMKAQELQLEKDNRLLKIKAMILRKSMKIFQYEEPFINAVDSSCTVIPDKLSSPIDIHRDDMVAAEEGVVKSEDTCTITVAPIQQLVQPLTNSLTTVFAKSESTPVFKVTEKIPKHAVVRPKLKLDIEASIMTSQTETMDTLKVPQTLVEGIKGFSLPSYVCDDKANMLSTITGSSTNQMTCLTISPQNRSSETKMPLGRYNATKTGKRQHQYNILEENIGQPSTSVVANRTKRKSTENIKLVVSKNHLLTVDSDDLESLNSVDTSIISDSNKSFSAKSKSNSQNNTDRKREASIVDLDLESVNLTYNQYRKLRDRNNEVSPTKSKLNRKYREIEMKEETAQLEKKNRLLKIKAAILQRIIHIFLSEEPFKNDVDSSCTFLPDKLLSPIDIYRDNMVAAEEVVVKSENTCTFTVAPIRQLEQPLTNSLCTVFVKSEPTPVCKVTAETHKPTVVCPKLKMDVEAAMMTSQTETIHTLKVPQPLGEEIKGFSLPSYVCDNEVNMLPKITGSSTNQMTCLTIPPQKRDSEIKMLLGKYNATKTTKRKHQYKTLEENIEQSSTSVVTSRPKIKNAENLKLVVPKKHHLTVDYDDDLESMNTVVTSIISDSDESFGAKSKSNYKKHTNKNNAGRKLKVSLVDSDLESVSSTSNRYRELRDRNNKASRKSRLKRRSGEVEMKTQVVHLEKYNRLLKMKVAKMVRLVKKLHGSFNVNR